MSLGRLQPCQQIFVQAWKRMTVTNTLAYYDNDDNNYNDFTHNDFAYNDFSYNDFTYNDKAHNT